MGGRKWHTLLGIVFLLVTPGHSESITEPRAKEKHSLVDLILAGVGDSTHGGKNLVKRYSNLFPLDKDYKHSSKETPALVSTLDKSLEIAARDLSLKDKYILSFGGVINFPPECSKYFFRIYNNTKDCTTPSFYRRCARLLKQLSLSPSCRQQ
ncbi:protein ALKAL-like isoform X2 [Callorhinchus milii]|uniref:Uncharacterized protein n=2 Tax=Callorhinchus milii TaxID=7868 RepID=V9LAT3_CALMI|nr:protein ALKAL-like isoform X2 [Callorhinchus milii]|eukprot:gi/632975209/ref/XP_007904100.1/ PREDICTED: protein FAM150A isoform X2 [Callorhinchus milii]